MTSSWTAKAFWVVLGLAGGLLIGDLVNSRQAQAVATHSQGDFIIATGSSNQREIEGVWLLDYAAAKLFYLQMNAQGGFGGSTELDLLRAFEINAARGDEPHFAMVTGRFEAQNVADVLYLAETSTQKILAIRVPDQMNPTTGAPIGPPQVIAAIPYGTPGAAKKGPASRRKTR